jgi:transposase
VGEQPSERIAKCEADLSLLSYIVVSKYVDHLPEYRQQKIFKRDGVIIPPSTMNGWVHKIAELFRSMAKHLQKEILSSGYIQMDESTIKVLATKKGKAYLGYMWVIYSPAKCHVCFMYNKGRDKSFPSKLLKDYQGKLQSDGYIVYKNIAQTHHDIELSNCNAHARRKFETALTNDKDSASNAMGLYQKMYGIER